MNINEDNESEKVRYKSDNNNSKGHSRTLRNPGRNISGNRGNRFRLFEGEGEIMKIREIDLTNGEQ